MQASFKSRLRGHLGASPYFRPCLSGWSPATRTGEEFMHAWTLMKEDVRRRSAAAAAGNASSAAVALFEAPGEADECPAQKHRGERRLDLGSAVSGSSFGRVVPLPLPLPTAVTPAASAVVAAAVSAPAAAAASAVAVFAPPVVAPSVSIPASAAAAPAAAAADFFASAALPTRTNSFAR